MIKNYSKNKNMTLFLLRVVFRNTGFYFLLLYDEDKSPGANRFNTFKHNLRHEWSKRICKVLKGKGHLDPSNHHVPFQSPVSPRHDSNNNNNIFHDITIITMFQSNHNNKNNNNTLNQIAIIIIIIIIIKL